MRKIYAKITFDVIVMADDNFTLGDLEENIKLRLPCDNADLEDFSVEDVKITDSK